MFLFRSKRTRTGRNTLDSIPPPSDAPPPTSRAARRLAMVARLADLAMEIAEGAAVHAKEAQKTPPEARTARPDPVLTFARISRCVKDTLVLEARFEAGILPPATREETESESDNDPRRPVIKNFILGLIEKTPQPKSIKAGFRQQLDPLITECLEDDLEQDHPPGAIVLDICQELGIPCTTAQMPDELLHRLHRQPTEAEKDSVATEVYRRIYGHDPPPRR